MRSRDLRALGALAAGDHVDVVVVADHGVPVAARIELTTVSSGPSRRIALVCPRCHEPKHLLRAREGQLQCNRCCRFRTRAQRERNRASWRRMGGREEDHLLRQLLRPGPTAARLRRAQRLAATLLEADRARVLELRERLESLKTAFESRR